MGGHVVGRKRRRRRKAKAMNEVDAGRRDCVTPA